MDIEEKVLLLGILKKDADENLTDVLIKLSDSKVFSLKIGKKILKELKTKGFIDNSELTILGLSKAQDIEKEFKI